LFAGRANLLAQFGLPLRGAAYDCSHNYLLDLL
jgi:hypothetical protein